MSENEIAAGYSRLTLTNESSSPALACAHVVRVAEQAGFDAEERAAIELGVEEATANVVRHAYPAGELNTFDVICRPTALGLEIRILDQGLPFDPTQLPDYHPDALLEEPGSGGLGTFLMKQAFDEVAFHNLGKQGKEICLVKHRSHVLVDAYSPPAPAAPAPLTGTITVRPMEAGEAIEVARCVYESYGYSYPYEHIYYPERVAILNANGELLSAVAVTAEGKITGHAALMIDPATPTIAELGIVVTKPDFRGHGIASRLGEYLLQRARENQIETVYTQAVTSHTFTQQFCHALGFRDCALLLGHAPASLKFRRIAENLPQRESLVLALLHIRPSPPPLIYPPEKHRQMILDLYRNLGIVPHCAAPTKVPCREESTELAVRTKSGLDVGVIEIKQRGADVEKAVQHHLIQLRRQHMAVAELSLPLGDPGMAQHLPAMESMGFFFAGLSPLKEGEDALLMHCLIDPAIDYANIRVHSPTAQALLAYVRSQDPNR
ncbi:MAG: GNAT family N-acetyltransferase [Sulfuricellaceae bacterium]|jgi:anti-sigma regulatory factor (Ser/Thr protein kinase)/GNAT superfamily N-acetyltransferase